MKVINFSERNKPEGQNRDATAQILVLTEDGFERYVDFPVESWLREVSTSEVMPLLTFRDKDVTELAYKLALEHMPEREHEKVEKARESGVLTLVVRRHRVESYLRKHRPEVMLQHPEGKTRAGLFREMR